METKPPSKSRTIISASIGMIGSIVIMAMALWPETVTVGDAEVIRTNLEMLVPALMALGGCLGAIYGRFRANTIIR